MSGAVQRLWISIEEEGWRLGRWPWVPNQIVSIAIQRHSCIAVSCMCWSCAVAVKAKVLMTDFLASACSPKSKAVSGNALSR